MAKDSLEKILDKQLKRQNELEKKIAAKQEREAKRRAQVEIRMNQASLIVSGQPTVGNLKILDKTAEELVLIMSMGYKGEDYLVSNLDVTIPVYIKNISFEFEKLKQYGMISDYVCWLDGSWEVSVLPSLFTYQQDKERACTTYAGNTNNFYGDVNGLQLQQGTINSNQSQSINAKFDFESVKNIVDQLKKYDPMYDEEFGEEAGVLRNKIEELDNLVMEKKDSNKTKVVLEDIKNLAIGVSGSLLANGILSLIGGVI